MAGVFDYLSDGKETSSSTDGKGVFDNYEPPKKKTHITPKKKVSPNDEVAIQRQLSKQKVTQFVNTKIKRELSDDEKYYQAHPIADKIVHNPVSQFIDTKITPVFDVGGSAMKGAITGDYSPAHSDDYTTTGKKGLDTAAKIGGTVAAFLLPMGGTNAAADTIRTGAETIASKVIPKASTKVAQIGKMAFTGAVESLPYSAQQIAIDKDLQKPADIAKTIGAGIALGAGGELAIAGLSKAAKAVFNKIKSSKTLTSAEKELVKNTPELAQLPEAKKVLLLPERSTSKIEVGPIPIKENAKEFGGLKVVNGEVMERPSETYSQVKFTTVRTPVKKGNRYAGSMQVGEGIPNSKVITIKPKELTANAEKTAQMNELRRQTVEAQTASGTKLMPEKVNKNPYAVADQFKREQPLKALPGEMSNKPKLANLEKVTTEGKNIKPVTPKAETDIDSLIEHSDKWKDKGGVTGPLRLQRETWDRNIVDIAGKNEGNKIQKAIFEPIHQNEASSNRFKNYWRNNIKSLNLSRKESELVQKLGEGKITLDEVKKQLPGSTEKIQNAVNTFRKFYDEVINTANETLERNGYKKVGKLKDYFPHFEEDDPVMKALGINIDVKDLPTDINGLTHQFRPGKNWFGNFLSRTGDKTTFDAVQGFDRYIEGISKVIYHTDDIQRLRQFTRKLRLKYSPKEIQDQVTNILKNKDLSREAKDAAIDELTGRNTTHLSNAVADLDEYTNVLAGKKDLADRAAERTFGRKIYNIANTITNRIGKNMVAINPASWITNFIPVTQSLATTRKDAVLQAMSDTMRNVVKNDDFIDRSTFLTNRVGSDVLDKSLINKFGEGLAAPFKWIDNFTSQVVTRSKYLEGIKKGLPPEEAMSKADTWAAKIMGDRSAGAQPTLFNQRNPVTRLLTQFQLEVNNQLSFLTKDIPREALKDGVNAKNVAKLGSAIGQLVIYSYLFNNVYEKMTGRRPALDPLGIAFDFKKDMNNPNLKKSEAVGNLANNVGQQLPFSSTLLNGGRIPISSALPDVNKISTAASQMATGEMPIDEGWKRIGSEAGKTAAYVALPFGAGQAKKSIEGLQAVNNGAEYYTNSKGEKQLKYPIAKTTENYIKAGVFGKSSLKENQDYYRNKVKLLSPEQTAAYDTAINKGVDPATVYAQIQIWRKLQPDSKHKSVIKDQKTKSLMSNDKLTSVQKEILKKLFLTTAK